MFTLIEKEEATGRWAELPNSRKALANQLWNVSSSELNGLNKTVFTTEYKFYYFISILHTNPYNLPFAQNQQETVRLSNVHCEGSS